MAKASRTLFGESLVWYGFESQNNRMSELKLVDSKDEKRKEWRETFRILLSVGYGFRFWKSCCKFRRVENTVYDLFSSSKMCCTEGLHRFESRFLYFIQFKVYICKEVGTIYRFIFTQYSILLWTSPISGTSLADSATSLGVMSMWNLIEEVW